MHITSSFWQGRLDVWGVALGEAPIWQKRRLTNAMIEEVVHITLSKPGSLEERRVAYEWPKRQRTNSESKWRENTNRGKEKVKRRERKRSEEKREGKKKKVKGRGKNDFWKDWGSPIEIGIPKERSAQNRRSHCPKSSCDTARCNHQGFLLQLSHVSLYVCLLLNPHARLYVCLPAVRTDWKVECMYDFVCSPLQLKR